ncbi:MAG: hypothetical protein J6U29_00820, partial [Bacteroidales bacterium]|nr:hypothetical protein [Bacteroidales bacterium]
KSVHFPIFFFGGDFSLLLSFHGRKRKLKKELIHLYSMLKACCLINSIQDRRSQCGVKRINPSVMRAGGTLLDSIICLQKF